MGDHLSGMPFLTHLRLTAGRVSALAVLTAVFSSALLTSVASAVSPARNGALTAHTPGALLAAAPISAARVIAADTVRGLVYDSLTNSPLAGAFISAEGAGVTTSSDSTGHFVVASDKRITRITAFHEALDVMGFGALTVARPEGDAPWTHADLVTPSLGTVWASVCGLPVPVTDYQGVLLGTARLPDNNTRVAGASIRVQYEEVLPRTGLRQLQELEAVTDSVGSYIICGAPLYDEAAMMGTSTTVQSGPVRIVLEGHPLRRVDLVLGPVDGPIDRWPTITGRVENEQGAPIAGARIVITERDSAATSDSAGAFSFREVPPGSRTMTVLAAGYGTVVAQLDVLYEGTASPIVTMEPAFSIAGLEGVRVTERSVLRRARSEFEERRVEGIAQFVDSTDIRAAGSLPAALAQVPGLLVERAPGAADSTQYEILGRGRNLAVQSCRADVFVDGVPAAFSDFYEVPLGEIAAVEVYRSNGFAPAMFAQFVTGDCALVVLWTRYGLRP